MTDTKTRGPIEVWLTQSNMEITCRVVNEDETSNELEVSSLSMRGAQREMTGWFISQGYTPAGRWVIEWLQGDSNADHATETSRKFKPVSDTPPTD